MYTTSNYKQQRILWLEQQYGYKNLFILHRLDRLTSGLIIFGKTKQKPQIFHKQNQSQQIKKAYYARVSGDFPWPQKTLRAEIQCVSHKDGIYKVSRQYPGNQLQTQKNSEIISKYDQSEKLISKEQKQQGQTKQNSDKKGQVTQKLLKIVKKQIKNTVKRDPNVKLSETVFKKIWFDKQSDSSLIQCLPISGRTHQIRVHLSFLGHPILNDTVYGGRFVGNGILKMLKEKKRIEEKQTNFQNVELELKSQRNQKQGQYIMPKGKPGQSSNIYEQINENIELRKELEIQVASMKEKLEKEWDYHQRSWEICLHSFEYFLEGKKYRTPPPYWVAKGAIGKRGN